MTKTERNAKLAAALIAVHEDLCKRYPHQDMSERAVAIVKAGLANVGSEGGIRYFDGAEKIAPRAVDSNVVIAKARTDRQKRDAAYHVEMVVTGRLPDMPNEGQS